MNFFTFNFTIYSICILSTDPVQVHKHVHDSFEIVHSRGLLYK